MPSYPPSLKPLPDGTWSMEHARHLANRVAFGASADQVNELRLMGRKAAVEQLLSGQLPGAKADFSPPKLLTPDNLPYTPESQVTDTNEDPAAARRRETIKRKQRLFSIQFPWLRAMLSHAAPREKLTLFWHGMLTSGFSKVDNRPLMLAQNARLRQLATGNYRQLVTAISLDPAMVRYLDIDQNSRRRPNENFARELLELFTLGEGNYTDADIKQLAKVFINIEIATPPDDAPITEHDMPSVRNKAGISDRMRIIERELEAIFQKPVCGILLCQRLLKYYLCDNPHPQLVKDLAQVLRKHDWDIHSTLGILFNSQYFYHPDHIGKQIKSPVQLLLKAMIDLQLEQIPQAAAELCMEYLGQSLFNPPNVAGWPAGRSWINSTSLAKRYQLMNQLIDAATAQADSRISQDLLALPQLPLGVVDELLTQWFPHLIANQKRQLLDRHMDALKRSPRHLLLALGLSPEYQLC